MDFSVKEYGALGNGKILDTISIQAAIDECFAAGGGRVILSGGTFLTGTIILKSNVELHLEADAVLLGSSECADFPERTDVHHVTAELLPRFRNACMIFAEEQENISISGPGAIDGNGEYYVMPGSCEGGWPYIRIDAPTPPRVVFFTGCKNVRVTDVTMRNQPSGWSYWIHDCDYVHFDRAKIDANLQYPNNDGIHINCSRNVTVSNCCISCGDDCLVVRANNASLSPDFNRVCEKVTVTNCNLTSHSAGIRIGWIKDGTIRNCTFSNLVMTDCAAGISLLLPGRGEERISDEGREPTMIENLSFNNIMMDRGYSVPILIYVHNNPATWCKAIRNIYFSEIHARCYDLPRFIGREDCPIENISLNNCTFEQLDRRELATPMVDEQGRTLLRGHTNLWNVEKLLLFRHVKNLQMNNTSFSVNN